MARKKAATRKKPQSRPRRRSLLMRPPASVFVVLAIGVLLAVWTLAAGAFGSQTEVPELTEPALITIPSVGTHITNTPITVVGTCPGDSYIKLYRNEVFSGIGLCSSVSTFQIQTDLFAGANSLQARAYNLSDKAGPVSEPVNVFYDVPTPSPNDSERASLPTAPTPGEKQLLLSTDYAYRSYYADQTIKWNIKVSGGLAPYSVSVDWGDKAESLYTQAKAGTLTIEHQYNRAGGYKNGYTLHLTARDTEGHASYLQLLLIIQPKADTPVATTAQVPKPPSSLRPEASWLKYLWPAYGFVVIVAIVMWLKERRGLTQSRQRPLMRRRHA